MGNRIDKNITREVVLSREPAGRRRPAAGNILPMEVKAMQELCVQGLVKVYGGRHGEKRALGGVSFTLGRGSTAFWGRMARAKAP